MSSRAKLSNVPSFALWLFLSAAAWIVGSRSLYLPAISDLHQVAPMMPDIALNALLLGVFLGAAGALALRRFLTSPLLWFAAAVIVAPLALSGAFLLQAAFLLNQVHSMGMALVGEGGGASFSTSPPISLAIAGVLLGLAWLPSLAPKLRPRATKIALWVAGLAACLTLGWLLSALIVDRSGPASITQDAVMGFVSGLLIICLLVVLERSDGAQQLDGADPASRVSRLARY